MGPDAADRMRMALAETGYDLEVKEVAGLVHVRSPGVWTLGTYEDRAHEIVERAYVVAGVDEARRCQICGWMP